MGTKQHKSHLNKISSNKPYLLYPDFTVGFGITPNQPILYEYKTARGLLPPVGNYTLPLKTNLT